MQTSSAHPAAKKKAPPKLVEAAVEPAAPKEPEVKVTAAAIPSAVEMTWSIRTLVVASSSSRVSIQRQRPRISSADLPFGANSLTARPLASESW